VGFFHAAPESRRHQTLGTQVQGSTEDVIWTAYLSFRMPFVQLLVACGPVLPG